MIWERLSSCYAKRNPVKCLRNFYQPQFDKVFKEQYFRPFLADVIWRSAYSNVDSAREINKISLEGNHHKPFSSLQIVEWIA